MKTIQNLLVIIPAFNEEKVIGSTIEGLKRVLAKNSKILVVDDGSNDHTKYIAVQQGALVVRHPINRGLGGALGTGLYWAKIHKVHYAITFDADGQHDPKDIKKMLQPLHKRIADVAIGSRTQLGWKDIPFDRRVIIYLSNMLTWGLFGVETTDSLSGFRAFNRRAIEAIQLRTDQMEVSNEFFAEMKRSGLRLIEVPIHVIYTDYSRSKGQQNSNALDVAIKMLLRLVR